jgi:hypothetical protein
MNQPHVHFFRQIQIGGGLVFYCKAISIVTLGPAYTYQPGNNEPTYLGIYIYMARHRAVPCVDVVSNITFLCPIYTLLRAHC